MKKLVLLRHGESIWNKENRFTGWKDVGLSEKGVEEAKKAGQLLKNGGYDFDVAYTSVLKRAIKTLWIVLEEMNLMWVPVYNTWRLNEKHYGALEGLNKAETAAKYGEKQVHTWRRSYDVPPPPLDRNDERYLGNEKMYRDIPSGEFPLTECLKDTVARFLPYWESVILPDIQRGKNVLIVAHGNSLRALVKHLDNISDDKIANMNIPTGIPLVYELDENVRPLKNYYLGNPEEVRKAIEGVAAQGKAVTR